MSVACHLGEGPSPSFPVGRLPSLGQVADRADAGDILAVLRLCRDRELRNGREPVKLAREALDRWWEKRRRVNDPVTGQNLQTYPWSRGALTLLRDHSATGASLANRLTLEHLWPIGAVVARIQRRVDDLDAVILADCLQHELGYAVITKAEDSALSRAGVRDLWLADPWDRYRTERLSDEWRVALDPATFQIPRPAPAPIRPPVRP